ncbi:hypothetical protein GCM10027280_54400 [Micromonospora polyrhachis]
MLRDQRETIRRCDAVPQGVDQVGYDPAVVGTERLKVQIPYRLPVARAFFAEIHAGRVGSVPDRSHMFFGPEDAEVPP